MDRVLAGPRYLYAVPPVLIAQGLFIWQLLSGFDWLAIAFGSWAWLYWTAVLLWIACAIFAARRVKWGWWVALTAPLAFCPAVGATALLISCASGNCL